MTDDDLATIARELDLAEPCDHAETLHYAHLLVAEVRRLRHILGVAATTTCPHWNGDMWLGDNSDCFTCHVREWAVDQLLSLEAK